MKITKMLSGGGIPPFTYYKPVAVNTLSPQLVASESSSSKSGATEKGKLTDKDLMEMLGKIDGLPNDMNKVYDMMSIFYRELELGVSTSSLSTTYLRALQLLKSAAFNYKEYDNAYKTVSKQKGLNEAAITSEGNVIVRDKNNLLSEITADEYLKNSDKYLTVSNYLLLQMRANDPNFAYSNEVFNIVNNGIGLETVDKLIILAMTNLGENATTVGGPARTKAGLIVEGMEFLLSAALTAAANGYKLDASSLSADGLYKAKLITKQLALLALMSILYIYDALPDNAKALLKLHLHSNENILKHISNKVISLTSTEYSFIAEPDTEGSGKKKSGDGVVDDTKLSPAALWYAGYGSKLDFILNPGTTYAIHSSASVMPLTTKEGESLGLCNLQQVKLSLFGGILNMQSASMGGQFINDSSWTSILTDGDVYSVDMPIDTEAALNGLYKPDLDLGKKMEQMQEFIRTNNINPEDKEKINLLCELFGLPLKYDNNGNYNFKLWKRFAVLNSTALGTTFTDDQSFNPYLSEILDEHELDGYIRSFEKSLGYASGKYDYNKAGWWDNLLGRPLNILSINDQMFKGTVYIPINDSMINALSSSGSTVSNMESGTLMELEALDQLKLRIQNYNNPGEFKL